MKTRGHASLIISKYNCKKEKNSGKSWVLSGFEPGTTDPKSTMLTPRPKFEEKFLKIPISTHQVFLNVDFSYLDNKISK